MNAPTTFTMLATDSEPCHAENALADIVAEKRILYPPNQVVSLLIEQAFRAQGLTPPQASVVSFSLQLRDMLLTTGEYLTVIPPSMVRVFNAKRLSVKALPIDLGIQTRPVALFTLKNRSLNPAAQLFMDCIRGAAASIGSVAT
jgi:DNA-binding transcriptional LysR family regulator